MTVSRRLFIWACLALFAITGLVLADPADAAPNDPDGYTAYVAKLLAAEAPDLTITVRERLTLNAKGKNDDNDMQVNLDRVWEFCRRNQRACDDATTTYVRNSVGMIKERLQPIEAAMLRVVVRPAKYVQQIRATYMSAPKATPDGEPVARPLVGDLWLLCVADAPSSIRVMNRGEVAKLGLSVEDAFALGQRNVAAEFKRMSDAIQPLPPQGFGYIEGNDYESSRILFHGDWAAVAAEMKGDLIVAVPGTGLTVYGDSGKPDAAPAMAAFARYALERMQRPISATLFRWTPSGWEPVTKP